MRKTHPITNNNPRRAIPAITGDQEVV